MIADVDRVLYRIYKKLQGNVTTAVVGMSGGADSTLTTILCTIALGKEHVYGIHMPYFGSPTARSIVVAEKLGITSITIPIGYAADGIINVLEQTIIGTLDKVNAGNVRARVRMSMLYGVAHMLEDGARVIGTGNLSEDFIGYDTKGGDALADIFPIGELVKSEVYQLLEHFRDKDFITEEMIDRVPSAGLWEGQTDEAELGYTYDELEPAIKKFYNEIENVFGTIVRSEPENEIEMFVMDRHLANKHKHQAPQVIDGLRKYCV